MRTELIISSESFSKMTWLLENRTELTGEFTEEQSRCIKELAIEFRRTALYNSSQGARYNEERETFLSMSTHEIYAYMLERIANAPTGILAHASAVLLIPILDDRLEAERRKT